MEPVTVVVINVRFAKIDVDQFGMITYDSVIVFRRIEILNQVIPDAPFPYDFAARETRLTDLHDLLRHQTTGVERTWISSLGDRFRRRLVLKGQEQHVTVWQYLNIVMSQKCVVKVPNE